MQEWYLYRHFSRCWGTFGALIQKPFGINQTVECTLEPPWIDNIRNISCIPEGTYTATLTRSNRFKRDLYELHDVPGRSGIRIHNGNLAGDTSMGYRSDSGGCILLGVMFDYVYGQLGVRNPINSPGWALDTFHRSTHGEPIQIKVSALPPEYMTKHTEYVLQIAAETPARRGEA